MNFGRGELLQSMKKEVGGSVDDLQHQLCIAGTSDYTNESIENFCHHLADRDRYGSNWTSGHRFGERPELHSNQFDDSVVNADEIPEVHYQDTYSDSSHSCSSKELVSNKVQKSFNGPVGDYAEDISRTFNTQIVDKKIYSMCRRNKAVKSSSAPVSPKSEIDDSYIVHTNETQPKTFNQSSYGDISPIKSSQILGGNEVGISSLKSSNKFLSNGTDERSPRPHNVHRLNKKSPRHGRKKSANSPLSPLGLKSEANTSDYTNGSIGKNSYPLAESNAYGPDLNADKNPSGSCDVKFSERMTDQFEDSETVDANDILELDKNQSSSAGSVSIEDAFKESYKHVDGSDPVGSQLTSYKGCSKEEVSTSPFGNPKKLSAALFIQNSKGCISSDIDESLEQFGCQLKGPASSTWIDSGENCNLNVSNVKTDGTQCEPAASTKGMGRGQRLKMVVASVPSSKIDVQKEIRMGCDPSYTNQSIENYLEKLRVKYDEEGFH